MDEPLSASDLAALLGVTERRAQQVMAFLEAAGFWVEHSPYGGRRIPRGLAQAVARIREQGRPLEALLQDPVARAYLNRQPEIGLGEAVGAVLHALAQVRRALQILGRGNVPGWPPAFSWIEAGLNAPQEEGL